MTTTPQLAVIVDTEEEFDWTKPLSRDSRGVTTIPAQARAHEIYDELGVVPTYVIDYPVASTPAAYAYLCELVDSGRAEIGAQLHPWVNPPDHERVSRYNSYQGNLPLDLERAKLHALTDAIEAGLGRRPRVFKAGRYGFGPNTARLLVEAGYEVDCSFVPYWSFAADGGPSYYAKPTQPFWLDTGRTLAEVPLTTGFVGLFRRAGPKLQRLFDNPIATRLHIPGVIDHLGLVGRSRLSPEGVPVREQKSLLRALVSQGLSTFTLAYHSPSLVPGHTPYVRDERDLAAFLASIRDVLSYFRDELGGRFTTLTEIRRNLA